MQAVAASLTHLREKGDIYMAEMPDFACLNRSLYRGFLSCLNDRDVRRSHFFMGRYENIYIDATRIPEITVVLNQVFRWAETLLNTSGTALQRGCWFNYMHHGDRTLPHTHDDDGELLSAVYYIRVPADSGRLVLGSESSRLVVQPKEGMAVLFPPDILHEVTSSGSDMARLSMGINIGT